MVPRTSSSEVRELIGLTRSEMIFDKAKLLDIYDKTIDEKLR